MCQVRVLEVELHDGLIESKGLALPSTTQFPPTSQLPASRREISPSHNDNLLLRRWWMTVVTGRVFWFDICSIRELYMESAERIHSCHVTRLERGFLRMHEAFQPN